MRSDIELRNLHKEMRKEAFLALHATIANNLTLPDTLSKIASVKSDFDRAILNHNLVK